MAFGIPSEDFHGGFGLPREEKVTYANVEPTEEERVNELENISLTIDEAGPTLGDKVEEINAKFVRSLAEIGIDTEGKDLLEIIAEMADKINRLQIELDQTKHDLRMEMLFV